MHHGVWADPAGAGMGDQNVRSPGEFIAGIERSLGPPRLAWNPVDPVDADGRVGQEPTVASGELVRIHTKQSAFSKTSLAFPHSLAG